MFLSGLEKAPPLMTQRLCLRPLVEEDVVEIARYLNDFEVANGLTYSPYPYTLDMAKTWLKDVSFAAQQDQSMYWAIVHRESGGFMGTIGFSFYRIHDRAEMHYWLGRPYWNGGYTTEAAKALIPFIFAQQPVQRLEINHFTRNLASRRVIEKCGFFFEGELRAYVKRFERYEDVRFYSLLRNEVKERQKSLHGDENGATTALKIT
jgi:RimJ/RimL family protein N-acetyltransferase